MIINDIYLLNFRKYQKLHLSFAPQINILCGPNASGKTTILEAIYMLSMAKSGRTSNDADMIKTGEELFYIKGSFKVNGYNEILSIAYDKKGKQVKRNENLYKSLSEFVGIVNVVMFTPRDFLLFDKGPSERRNFIDIIICQVSKNYMRDLYLYRKILKERNLLLKELIHNKNNKNLTLLEVLTTQLANHGDQIIQYRKRFINKISKLAGIKYQTLTDEKNKLELVYNTSTNGGLLLKQLNDGYELDLAKGSTKTGPHLDDINFILNGQNALDFGSQGEKRTIILSIKLALLELMHEIKKEYPILLLDDVFSELDNQRQNALVTALKTDIQTIITTTSLAGLNQKLLTNAKIIETEKIGVDF
ncbi:MAG TPA: DNA replication/repair protein RecF [Acholeplasmataceae bacterium]|nr:DNA replication/repair protein RecF [Acholeplasmataceae bacterium]